ncbi:MAG TPA: hypothetical protein VFK82_12905, partial [Burkholderiaceae bacterium]|nr:hypothetical protein [Burkholderiaceae bacterium]
MAVRKGFPLVWRGFPAILAWEGAPALDLRGQIRVWRCFGVLALEAGSGKRLRGGLVGAVSTTRTKRATTRRTGRGLLEKRWAGGSLGRVVRLRTLTGNPVRGG